MSVITTKNKKDHYSLLWAINLRLLWLSWRIQTNVGQHEYLNLSFFFNPQVFATLSTFYLPLAIILFLYWRIFMTAKKRIRRRKPQGPGLNLGRGPISMAATTTSSGSTSISMVTAETACTIASAMAAAVGVLELGRPPIEEEETSTACRTGQPSHRTIMRRNTSVAAVVAASANTKRRNMV